MDIPTKNVSTYIKEKGINLAKMARDTGYPYAALYDSLLNEKKETQRELRAGEFCDICAYLEVNPMDFAEDKAG